MQTYLPKKHKQLKENEIMSYGLNVFLRRITFYYQHFSFLIIIVIFHIYGDSTVVEGITGTTERITC